MNSKQIKSATTLSLFIMLAACGTEGGNPESSDTLKENDIPIRFEATTAHALNFRLRLCASEIRLTKAGDIFPSVFIPLANPVERLLTNDRQEIAVIQTTLKQNEIIGVSLNLSDVCGTGFSARLSNEIGYFLLSENIRLRFDSALTSGDSIHGISLIVDDLFNGASNITSNDEFKSLLGLFFNFLFY